MAPKKLETSVLHALAIVAERPKAARDALKILREAQLRASFSDWFYQEAMGIVQAAAGDRLQAVKAFDLAIANAPSHLKHRLMEARDVAADGMIPTIDWRERLIAQWKF
jgi:predicted Zn-dependent protease